MKIKKLTVHGFKSFVDKVSFNFPGGTSAVIGPNGCGKSNIVDSIRWVLGEQNARHLRGKLMEDVIFNGSEGRKPLGMAEVVLTFSNEDGQAPAKFANFSEIEISRRLYRSGESEYYINKVQSRLRDIVDLFTDTGIGSRAYSIIEQGQVGWLINAKPEERRIIFEEAAGINKFKHKKEAALRRLEATKENLTRVNDIISEVKRQLNSLNRQAKKAERYKVLREELKAVEVLLSSLEFHKVSAEMNSALKRLEDIKDQELALCTLINEKEIRIEELKAAYAAIEARYKDARERLFELERLIQSEEQAGVLARMRAEEIERAGQRLGSEIQELELSIEEAKAQTDLLAKTLGELSASIGRESEDLQRNSVALDSITSELRQKEERQREQKADSMRLSARLSDIRHSIQSSLKDEEIQRIREARAATEREGASSALALIEGPLSAIKEGRDASVAAKIELEGRLRDVRQTIEALETGRAGQAARLKEAKDNYSRVSARLSTLEEMERNFEGLKGGAKAIMLKRSAGIHGLLADVIETNHGYEKAVEAVMGDRLQYVLVESHKEGVEAIEYLKKSLAGRGSFIPVKDARAGSPVPVEAGGFYSGARELINELKIKDGYQGIVTNLLGDVLLVDNLDTAIEFWRQNGAYKTLVTLDGEVLDAQGTVTGGRSGAEDGILQKRSEIKNIRAQTSELEAETARLEAGLKKIEDDIQGAKTLSEELREELHGLDLKKVNLEGELKKNEEEAARLRKIIESSEAEGAQAARRLAEIASAKAALNTERDGLEAGLAAAEAAIAELASEISARGVEKEEIQQIVTELKVALARSREKEESLKRELGAKEGSIGQMTGRIRAKKEEIESGRIEAEAKVREAEALKARIEELLLQSEAAKKEEVAITEELTASAEGLKSVEAGVREDKARLSECSELKGELTVDLKEMELGLANLKERMAEKYGADIMGLAPNEGEPVDVEGSEARREELKSKIAELGEVSLSALEEYNELERRHQFLLDQQTDLSSSVDALHTAITRINRTTREKFKTAFEEINIKFQETFPRLFHGGKAELRLTDDGDLLEAGIEIVAQPPGKRLQNITLLSGGEKALTATSLIFAIFLIKPSPFCLLDEVDAPLDEANIDRFNMFVRDMSRISQFVLITHNKKTMEMADALYGITMEEPGVSKIISVRF